MRISHFLTSALPLLAVSAAEDGCQPKQWLSIQQGDGGTWPWYPQPWPPQDDGNGLGPLLTDTIEMSRMTGPMDNIPEGNLEVPEGDAFNLVTMEVSGIPGFSKVDEFNTHHDGLRDKYRARKIHPIIFYYRDDAQGSFRKKMEDFLLHLTVDPKKALFQLPGDIHKMPNVQGMKSFLKDGVYCDFLPIPDDNATDTSTTTTTTITTTSDDTIECCRMCEAI